MPGIVVPCVAALVLLLAVPAGSQPAVDFSGRVFDADSKRGIENLEVKLTPPRRAAVDSRGDHHDERRVRVRQAWRRRYHGGGVPGRQPPLSRPKSTRRRPSPSRCRSVARRWKGLVSGFRLRSTTASTRFIARVRLGNPWQKSRRHSAGDACRGLRCSSFKYGPIFSVVAPCPRGASPPSVLAVTFTTGCRGPTHRVIGQPGLQSVPRRACGD